MAGRKKCPTGFRQAFEIMSEFVRTKLPLHRSSPAVTVNTIDFRAASFRQVGRSAAASPPLARNTVENRGPDTLQPVGVDEAGLLLGARTEHHARYLNKPEKTAEVLRDGWYNTGDVREWMRMDFIRITDRLSRFSKIGARWCRTSRSRISCKSYRRHEQAFVVTAVPDEKKANASLCCTR